MSEFVSTICTLKRSDRATIKHFTLMADANKENAELIVNAIQKHIIQSPPEVKLSALYLIDSIVKNVVGRFVDLFDIKLESIFYAVFVEADIDIRIKMYVLRKTWKKIFSERTLLALDTKINQFDPAWPIATPVVAKLDHLKAKKRCLELQLVATKQCMNELDQKLQDETTNLEKEVTLFASTEESILQSPDSKRIKLDWMELKIDNDELDNKDDDVVVLNNKDDALPPANNGDDVVVLNNRDDALRPANNDDDDDIEIIEKEPTIIEIDDDDDDDDDVSLSPLSSSTTYKDNAASRVNTSSPTITSSTNVLGLDGHWINNSTIDVKNLFENSVKIKVEPKDNENSDDDDCFEDIGEIFYTVPENADNRDEERITSSQRVTEPRISLIPAIDGNVPSAAPINIKIKNNIKINIKSKPVCITSDINRTEKTKKSPRKKIVSVRPKADETSALCTIM